MTKTTALLVPNQGIYEYLVNEDTDLAYVIFWACKGSRGTSQGTSCSVAKAREHYTKLRTKAV
jgi:hypothetical protein